MADLLDRLNTALAGRYAIERELGEGGERMISDCRWTIADWRFDGDADLKLPIANLKSAISRASSTVLDRPVIHV